jgi:hypothetical protein
MFDRLPGGQQSQAVETPVRKTRKVALRIVQREWAANKADRAVIGKIGWEIRATLGEGNLAIATEIDAPEDHMAPPFVTQNRAIHGQSARSFIKKHPYSPQPIARATQRWNYDRYA